MSWWTRVLHAKVYEPQKRNKDGLRWIMHRFPIKGGISLYDVMRIDLASQTNPLWDRLVKGRLD